MKNTSIIPKEKLLINNNNIILPDNDEKNVIQYSNQNENFIISNIINSDKNEILQNFQEKNGLNNKMNNNFINNINYNSNNEFKTKYDSFDIIYLLKNNPDIYSYIHIFDYLAYDDLLNPYFHLLFIKLGN